jgi:tetratricopeptide (TPR) repeat protein
MKGNAQPVGGMPADSHLPSLRSGQKTVQIVPFSSDPICLGGLPSSGASCIPLNLAYAHLSRPAALPPAHSQDKTSLSPKAERLFQALFEGSFVLKWEVVQGNLILEAYEKPDDKFLLQVKLLSNTGDGGICLFSLSNPIFSDSQKKTLAWRIIHRFFRAHGVSVSDHIQAVLCYMQKVYGEKKWYKELLDFTITCVDASFNSNYENMGYLIIRVGEALEATGQYRQAALVYQDFTDALPNAVGRLPGGVNEVFALTCAGLAYKRDGDRIAAEAVYVRALWLECNKRCVGTQWDPNEYYTKSLIQRMIELYYELALNNGGQFEICFPIFQGLLYAAEYQAAEDITEDEYKEASMAVGVVKHKHTSSKINARKALRAAVKTPTVQEFRSCLISYHNPLKSINIERNLELAQQMEAEMKKRGNKENARSIFSSSPADQMECSTCSYPVCGRTSIEVYTSESVAEAGSFMFCPCRLVR